jgi:hypothetical protein
MNSKRESHSQGDRKRNLKTLNRTSGNESRNDCRKRKTFSRASLVETNMMWEKTN